MFAICYYALLCVASVLILPVLLCFSAKSKYKISIPARFFLWNNSFKSLETPPELWFHACSLGEVNSLQGILKDSILQKHILLTTITNTGFKRANELFSSHKNIAIRFLPFEIFLPFVMPKSIKKLVVLEAELWFMLFFCAKKIKANTILLNARISTKSFPKYKKYKFFYKQLFKNIDVILCQQDSDKERFLALGANNIETLGNIKALLKPQGTKNITTFQNFKENLQKNNATIIIAASTHKGEEEIILEHYLRHFKDSKNHYLIIAPRHPERFSEVWDLLKSKKLNATKYSENSLNAESSIILLDKLGELINAYSIANVVILGGSFVKMGGHNPLECAYFRTKLISGEYIFNQLALFDLVEHYTIANASNLGEILQHLEHLEPSKIKDSTLHLMQDKITQILTN